MLDTDAAPLLNLAPLDRAASPARFFPLAGRLVPWFAGAALLLTLLALAIGILAVPTGEQLGETSRIVFIHVPAAWMSLLLFVAMAGCAALVLANVRLPALLMVALAPTGAMFTIVALWTGVLWGRPTWGAWWVWDARLTCELILFFLYVGFLALRASVDDRRRADRFSAVLVLIGVLNLPIIYWSLSWWNPSPHQGVAASLTGSPKMASSTLGGVLVMAAAFWMYANAVVLTRVRCLMLERRAEPGSMTAEAAA
ncbi:MAG TPA: cytochrome c biogenesis protein CcsA [Ramlibacter sp.]|nr:cytochrome c biogenesis protein CcsA [Ramlibacter sp.]